ncbi:MAG TPA: hypothetical protein VGJ50_25455 [Streptosporangiaceae bacterium]|jgi:hypothetical protein
MVQDASNRQLIVAGTRLGPVPLVPEIRLHQASDPISLWQRTEDTSGRTGLDPPFWAFAWAAGQALARYLLDHAEVVQGRWPPTTSPASAQPRIPTSNTPRSGHWPNGPTKQPTTSSHFRNTIPMR